MINFCMRSHYIISIPIQTILECKMTLLAKNEWPACLRACRWYTRVHACVCVCVGPCWACLREAYCLKMFLSLVRAAGTSAKIRVGITEFILYSLQLYILYTPCMVYQRQLPDLQEMPPPTTAATTTTTWLKLSVKLSVIYCETAVDLLWNCRWFTVKLSVIYCKTDGDLLWNCRWLTVKLSVTYCETVRDLLWNCRWFTVKLSVIYCETVGDCQTDNKEGCGTIARRKQWDWQ